MRKILFTLIVLASFVFIAQAQLKLNSSGRVGIGNDPDFYANLNIAPEYSDPSSTNLIIGNWWNNNYGLISMGVHYNYSWIQSWHVKPMHINRMGNHTIFGSESSESVGIGYGMVTPSAKLEVLGNVLATGFIQSSDERLKTNIREINIKERNFRDIKGVTYNLNITNRGFSMDSIDTSKVAVIDREYYKREHFGFVAQEVRKILPEVVFEDNDGTLGIDYQAFIPVLFEWLKSLDNTIENLQNEIIILQEECCQSNNLKSGYINDGENFAHDNAVLYQNAPNPFSARTTIRFEIPQTVQHALLYIFNMNGTLLKSIQIYQRGEGNVILNANEFKAGLYLYSLVTDGRIVDTKQMLLRQ
jgi:hypothetical protein